MAVPVFICGCETWILIKKDYQNVQAAVMRFLWVVAGYKPINHNKNEYIRAELNIYNLCSKIKEFWQNG